MRELAVCSDLLRP